MTSSGLVCTELSERFAPRGEKNQWRVRRQIDRVYWHNGESVV